MKNIKAVLFDFDGTLLNTNALVFASYNYAFNKVFGRDITEEEIHSLFGRPLYSSLADFGEEHQDALFVAYREFNGENLETMVEPFEHTTDGVRMIKALGYKTGIVTSKRMETLLSGMKKLNLENGFDIIITPEDTKKHKPDAGPLLEACRRLGILPEECLYVGDSIFDFECAKNAGAHMAGVNYSTTREALLTYDPLFMVDNMAELANLLKNR